MKRYSNTYLGTIPASDEHICNIIRSAIKGTGFSLWRRGRNPNRKQFYHLYTDRARQMWTETKGQVVTQRGGLQQDLPLKHATSFALYLKPANSHNVSARIGAVRRKVAEALAGQPVFVGDTVAYLNEVKNLGKLHEVVTAIGKACKVLAMGPC